MVRPSADAAARKGAGHPHHTPRLGYEYALRQGNRCLNNTENYIYWLTLGISISLEIHDVI